MGDLKHKGWMYLKAILLVMIGIIACVLILLEHPEWKVAVLLVVAVWAFARAYYFAFYVVQHYIDSSYKFSGLFAFALYMLSRKRSL